MKAKNEDNPSDERGHPPSQPTENHAIGTSPTYNLHQLVWNGLNFTAVAAVTSGAVVAVQSPIKWLLINLMKDGAFLSNYSGGTLALFRAMYAGTLASFTGSSVRTIYVTGTKRNKPGEITEEVKETLETYEKENVCILSKAGYVMTAALGDIFATQLSESLSQYKKIKGFLPNDFKWNTVHNMRHLMVGGFAPRYVSGLVNFSALCVGEDEIAKNLPITDKNTRHFVAGALSGMTAAMFSYPFTTLKDYVLLQSTINEKKQLVTKSSFSVMKELAVSFAHAPKDMGIAFLQNAKVQLPVRMVFTGAVFATVAGVGELLGNEPLTPVVPERFQPSMKAGAASGSQSFFSRFKSAKSTQLSISEKSSEAANSPTTPRH